MWCFHVVYSSGFTAVQNKDYLSVFQLTDTGDLFFQTLKLHTDRTLTNKDVPRHAVSVEGTIETGESENFQSQANGDGQSSQSDSETERRQASLGQLTIINNVDDDDQLNASDTNKDISKEPLSHSIGNNPTCSTRPRIPRKDPDFQTVWNKWLKPIFKKASAKKHAYFRRIRTDDLKGLKGKMQYNLIKDRSMILRRDLQEVMRKKESLLHGVTYLPHLEVMPVPDPVDPDNWDDDVSQRLAASWEGNWKSWWEEKLGLNQDKKIAALRRMRQRRKRSRARQRISLSGSFTSSQSYQESIFGSSQMGSQFQSSDDGTSQKTQDTDMEEWRSRPEIQKKSPVILRRFLNDQSTVHKPESPPRRSDEDLLTSPSSIRVRIH